MDFSSVFELTSWDITLLALLAVLVFRWWRRQQVELPAPKIIPPMPMTDLTPAELKKYNGVDDERILLVLNGTIYDVTRGKSFYGPGSSYGALAGHDATRALGKMEVTAVSDEWDDHENLTAEEKETANEWEQNFKSKYPKVGRLVKDEKEKHDYEAHWPEVPQRWDEPVWLSHISVQNEQSILKAFLEKVSAENQRECLSKFEDSMCGLSTPYDAEPNN